MNKNIIYKNLTWRILNALYEIRTYGFTERSIVNHDYILYLINNHKIKKSPKYKKRYIPFDSVEFNDLFDTDLLEIYNKWHKFLTENELLFSDKCDYEEEDIICLMNLKEEKDNGLLDKDFIPNIHALKSYQANIQYVSNAVFNNDKHLRKDSNLEKATKKILNVQQFLYDSQEAIYYLRCPNPKALIVCENHFFLKQASLADTFQIDLVCTEGKNYKKLNRFITGNKYLNIPVFYSCDWDKDGLQIYEGLKEFLKDSAENFKKIKLLTPYLGKPKPVCDIKHNHKSEWIKDKNFSGLTKIFYTKEQIEIINQLIKKEEWIAEQGFNFEEMLKQNNCI